MRQQPPKPELQGRTARVRFFLAAPLLTLLLCTGLEPPAPPPPSFDICPCQGPSCDTTAHALRFGFYDEDLLNDYAGTLSRHLDLWGSTPAYLLWFIQIDDPFPATVVSENAFHGIRTIISMNLKSLVVSTARNDTLLNEISDGVWDSTLALFAKRAAAYHDTVYLRFGYEMNGNWFPWGSQPTSFVNAWQHTHDLFVRLGATKIRWVFSPGILWDNRSFEADIEPYYPGDKYVDIVSLDGYNFGDQYDQYHCWQGFGSIFSESLDKMQGFRKPMWITETACPVDGVRRPEWVQEMIDYLARNPCVQTIIWFSAHKPDEPNFRLEDEPVSWAILREWLAR